MDEFLEEWEFAVAMPSKSRVAQLFHSSWEYGDQRSSAPLNGLSGESGRDSEDTGMQAGIMSLLFLQTGADVRHGHRSRGCNMKQLECFLSFWGIANHRERYTVNRCWAVFTFSFLVDTSNWAML